MLQFDPANPLMFSSGLFWVLFLVFLPLFAMFRKRRAMMMVFVTAFSLYFFYKSSGWYLLLLVFTALLDWYLARLIGKETDRRRRRIYLTISIVCSLGILVFFKYTNFILANIGELIAGNFQPLDLILPVGISFYTFRTISYVVDVYKGKLQPTNSFLEYIFFLSYFPCLIAGPIVRADRFLPQIRNTKPIGKEMIYGGFWLVILGIIKKAVIADYLAQYNNLVFGNPSGYSGVELLMAVLGYAMQIYCDFSGYSDMAIGLGSIMGFDLGINFDFPYRLRNVTEFWRRWHISLSFWLRDYVYISLGGNRRGKLRQYLNLMATMLLGGLWHGAAWTFVVWGAGHGAALCIHKAVMKPLKKIPDNWFVVGLSTLLTFIVVAVLWVFFRAESFADAGKVLSGIVNEFDPAYFPVFFERRLMWCV
ncbi:MAG: MBOAT family protein, partial [Muribaculaceae bacterium]|nr:MBOAT family protein [Muribaculaceae bacterium]